MGVRPDDTMKSFDTMWKLALSRCCNVLALTVPETAGNFTESLKKRKEINDRILKYRAPN